jgi:PhnB protein
MHQSYSANDAFCDENGNINPDFPRTFWTNRFSEANERSTVHITLQYQQLADLEKIIELGFREGFSMAMDNLDHYFLTASNKQ